MGHTSEGNKIAVISTPYLFERGDAITYHVMFLQVAVILYFLYTKLGLSAIIGTAASVIFITPLQFYIGKKISDNSKEVSKCTDHRISKITEILQGMNVIKLYVWEDLFNEKILNLREVELKLLNKDSIYWSFLSKYINQIDGRI